MKPSGFSLGFEISYPVQHYGLKVRNLHLCNSVNLLEEEAFLQKHQHKTVTVYNDKAHLKSDDGAIDKVTWLLL